MRITSVFAPAKINLALHVTGQREDGYHLLDSLVAFAPVGDWLELCPATEMSLSVDGPESAGVPTDMSNLVLRAAALSGAVAAFHLHKVLPPASGIGGGSSDAAAALRGLGRPVDAEAVARLGADIPMCRDPRPHRVRGIGEDLTPVALPDLPALLVNPRVAVPTPPVFKALTQKDNPLLPEIPHFLGVAECIAWIAAQRNDLQAPAITTAPVIADTLAALQSLPGCRLARMSGSGATCFALFDTDVAAQAGHDALAASHPHWWIAAGALGDQSARAAPQPRAMASS